MKGGVLSTAGDRFVGMTFTVNVSILRHCFMFCVLAAGLSVSLGCCGVVPTWFSCSKGGAVFRGGGSRGCNWSGATKGAQG